MTKWVQDSDSLEPFLIEVDDRFYPDPVTKEDKIINRIMLWICLIIFFSAILVIDIIERSSYY